MATLSHCADLVRRFDHDRFLCALFAPEEAREALMALLAFNLEVARIPEMVREPLAGRIRLQWWHDTIEAAYRGQRPDHPVALSLFEAIEAGDLSQPHFERYLEARTGDLDEVELADLPALEVYAGDTAGALTELACEILGQNDDEILMAARDVGAAWGLVGLMRALPYQTASGRCPLPAALVQAHGLRLPPNPGDAALPAVVAEVATAARTKLEAARQRRCSVARAALPALFPATLAEGYLVRLEKAGFDPWRLEEKADGRLWRFIRLGSGALLRRY